MKTSVTRMKRTRWYPASVKPVHTGIYERKMKNNEGKYSYWGGSLWYGWGATLDIAKQNYESGYLSNVQDARWRGLRK